jgi:hypothetical protein
MCLSPFESRHNRSFRVHKAREALKAKRRVGRFHFHGFEVEWKLDHGAGITRE